MNSDIFKWPNYSRLTNCLMVKIYIIIIINEQSNFSDVHSFSFPEIICFFLIHKFIRWAYCGWSGIQRLEKFGPIQSFRRYLGSDFVHAHPFTGNASLFFFFFFGIQRHIFLIWNFSYESHVNYRNNKFFLVAWRTVCDTVGLNTTRPSCQLLALEIT